MKSTTIDRLDLRDHVRWANDQNLYDPVFLDEAKLVVPHPEITGLSAIYSSKVEELFELQKKNQHWAAFAPPEQFYLFGKSLFSYELFPHFGEKEDEREKDEEQEEKDEDPLIDLVQNVTNFTSLPHRLFEKDRTTILNLLESITWVNELLSQIHARKLQYQKG